MMFEKPNVKGLKIILLLPTEWEAFRLKATEEKSCCYLWALLIFCSLTGNVE